VKRSHSLKEVADGGQYCGQQQAREKHIGEPSMGKLEAPREPVPPRQATLRGHRLQAAKAAWVILAFLVVGLSVAFLPVTYADYRTVCSSDAECDTVFQLKPQDVLALRELGLSVSFYATYMLATQVFLMLGFWTIGAAIFWRKADDWVALLFALMLVTFGASSIVEPYTPTNGLLSLLGTSVAFLGYALFYASFFVFPDGRFVPRWGRWAVAVWIVYQASFSFLPNDSPLQPEAWPTLLLLPLVLGLFGTMVFAQVYRYLRISEPVERQQTKWVVFGLTAAISLTLTATIVPAEAFPTLLQPGVSKVLYGLSVTTVVNLSLLLIPLSIGVAILRYRLWDIDVLINRTLVYGSLTVTLALVYFAGVATTEAIFHAITSQERQPQVAVVVSTLVIAALFMPLRRRIQGFIDRRFYRRKYDARKTLEAFSAKLRDETDLDALSDDVISVVSETMQPAHVSLWLRPDRGPKKHGVVREPRG
jgi:hypothetical protein